MTTFVQFAPPQQQAFSFQAALDGTTYQLTVRWSVSGRRWYVMCFRGDDELVFNLPLIGSPVEGDINLAGGYFAVSTLVFREHTNQFEISP